MNTELRVAVVGAGPAGMYLADALVFQRDLPVRVDVFDRLPTPFGLLRYGVAPDHLKMKSLARALQRTLDDERVRFFGNVEIGCKVSVDELRADYHAVCYSFGAAGDRTMDIPGEKVDGSVSATEFVAWYSGHPDVASDRFDLTARSVAVVGAGNVAVDVARVLVKDAGLLSNTDMPQHVLEVLGRSQVTDVHILSRRGPVHAKFTHKELMELGELKGVDVIVNPKDLDLRTGGQELIEAQPAVRRNLDLLRDWSQRELTGAPRRLHVHFWARPAELVGSTTVEYIRVEATQLDGEGQLVGVGNPVDLPVQMVLRCVGYRGAAVAGVPLHPSTGTVPSLDGRVVRDGEVSAGEYVAGWIGRGPVGVLGTNRADAEGVVQRILQDAPSLLQAERPGPAVVSLLRNRDVTAVSCEGWSRIDAAEVAKGEARGRSRTKLSSWHTLLTAAAAE